ncbi:MAG TPA: serine/threonine-protein kinase, partial [Polyangiaceae bacterium]|nr:serine/threonine-protein kinase [Polyangiaceae bacterium]
MGSLVGQVIDGRYRVDAVIALGGMGAVLRGTHLVLGQAVAIKVMLDATMRDPLMRERVFREARILAQVRSPAIAAIFDAGLLPDGTLYIVMELLEGDELEALITKRSLGLPQIARLLAQVCEGLADAHAQGIVHRDLKPANIFVVKKLSGELTAKIIDFGISKRVGEMSETTTVTTIIGSPYYMAPEQANSSRDVDHRADIWSLGVILYRVVVGKLPFEGTISAVLAGIRTQDPRFPEGLDPGFRRVIQGCLEKDLNRRYQSALDVQAALLPLAEGPPRRDSSISQRAVIPPGLEASQASRAFVESGGTEKTKLQLGGLGPASRGGPVPYTDEGEMVTTRMASPLSGGASSPPSVIRPLAGRRQEPLARTTPLAPSVAP